MEARKLTFFISMACVIALICNGVVLLVLYTEVRTTLTGNTADIEELRSPQTNSQANVTDGETDKLKIRISDMETDSTNNKKKTKKLQTRITVMETDLTKKVQTNGELIQKLLSLVPQSDRLKICGAGVQSATIVKDDQLSSSTQHHDVYAARHGRLLSTSGNGAWCSLTEQANEWMQVDFKEEKTINGVVTQSGTSGSGERSYKVSYQRNNEGFTTLTDQSGAEIIYTRDDDGINPKSHAFPYPITGRYFRITILTWNGWPCLRFDFLTC